MHSIVTHAYTRNCCHYKMAVPLEFCFSYNGKEYLFVEETKKSLENLQCPVCFEIVLEPVQTSCGHLFCKKCVTGVTRCPACREQFTSVPDHFNNRRVKSLRVKCPFTANGCKWVGDLGDVGDHKAARCEFLPKPCPYCDFTTIQEDKFQKHLMTCDSHTFQCPNGCGAAPSRKNLDQHLEECPEQLVRCKFSILGCDAVLPRKSMESHVATSAEHSTEFLLQHVMKMTVLFNQLCAKSGVSNLFEQMWLMNKILRKEPVPPWVIKMEGFQKKKEENEEWYSDPVYSHFGGYKMCLGVYPNGLTQAKGTHVSVFTYVYLMRGDNDDNLKWPFKGTIKVSLLNQLEDGQHHTREPWSLTDNVPKSSRRVTEKEKGKTGWGQPQFINHQDLSYKVDKNCQYLKDDTLFFRVDCFEPKID